MPIILGDIYIGSYPLGQPFGANPDYYKQFNLIGHEGQDIPMPVGTPIISSTDGVVVRDVDDPVAGKNYGIFVAVWDRTQSCATYYCHLSSNVVTVGQSVLKGQLLGYSGNTGNTTGPHLHFGLCKTDANGTRINQDNGYAGFINPSDGRIATWDIKNPTKPVEPPPAMNPADNDTQNAMNFLIGAFRSLPETDTLSTGNLEGFTRALVQEHQTYKTNADKAAQFDGFLSKWISAWNLTPLPEGPLHTVEIEMGTLMTIEDSLNTLRDAVEKAVHQTYTDDVALIKALDATQTEMDAKDSQIKTLQSQVDAMSGGYVKPDSWIVFIIKKLFRKNG